MRSGAQQAAAAGNTAAKAAHAKSAGRLRSLAHRRALLALIQLRQCVPDP